MQGIFIARMFIEQNFMTMARSVGSVRSGRRRASSSRSKVRNFPQTGRISEFLEAVTGSQASATATCHFLAFWGTGYLHLLLL